MTPVAIRGPCDLLGHLCRIGVTRVTRHRGINLLTCSPLNFNILSNGCLSNGHPRNTHLAVCSQFTHCIGRRTGSTATRCTGVTSSTNLSVTRVSLTFIGSHPFIADGVVKTADASRLGSGVSDVSLALDSSMLSTVRTMRARRPGPSPWCVGFALCRALI